MAPSSSGLGHLVLIQETWIQIPVESLVKLAEVTTVCRAKIIGDCYEKWISSKDSVLDIGCGTGIVAKELQTRFGIKRMAGCDIEKYNLVPIEFVKQTAPTKLPFKNKEFEVAMFNDVLHHMLFRQQEKLILEAMRVANKVLIFELKPNLINKIGDYFLNIIHNPNMKVCFTYRNQEDWEKLFKKLKLEDEYQEVVKPFWYPFSHLSFMIAK